MQKTFPNVQECYLRKFELRTVFGPKGRRLQSIDLGFGLALQNVSLTEALQVFSLIQDNG